jgi:NTP pyrophosphatase (non-canonical NTP hydrolase)
MLTPKPKTMNQTFEQLKEQVVQWAENRNLLKISNHPVQFIKVVEELGELGSAILKSNRQAEYDGFGDVLVTLIILAEQRGVDIVKALETAYEEIMNRRGSTVNGIFVKKSDS